MGFERFLTSNERRALAAAHFNANEPVSTLAKHAGLSRHVFQYALDSLRERELIHFSPSINLFALGYQMHSLLFSLSTRKADATARVRRFLRSAQGVVFAVEHGGEFQFGVTLATKGLHDVEAFLAKLCASNQVEIFQKQFVSHLNIIDFRADYLFSRYKKCGTRLLRIMLATSREDIDTLDKLILAEISSGKQKSCSEIGRALDVPATTVQFRVGRLEERKIITGYRFLIATHKLGVQRLWVALGLKSQSPRLVEALIDFCTRQKQVRYASSCLGAWDFDIGFDGCDGLEQSAFIQDLYDEFSAHIVRAQVSPIFDFLRVSPYPF
jgi:DNA-binding Lrp family transcriptional regulator